MALTFPSSPTTGQVYTTANGITYSYNGTSWVAINSTYAIGGFRKLDSIASQFNGSNTTFNLTVSSVAITPGSAQNLNIVIGGVPQEPGVAYTLSNNSIQFTAAPTSGMSFYGVVLGDVMNIGVPSDSTVTSSKLDTNIRISGTLTSNNIIVSGNVGIGNTNPGSTLTVGGVIELTSGGIKFADGTTQTSVGTSTGKAIAMSIVFGG